MPFVIERNDLAHMDVDAIVVTANEQLKIGGGVGLSVARAAGLSKMRRACAELAPCPTGHAVITPGFALAAHVVIHVVGPVWQGGHNKEKRVLRRAYDSALDCAASVHAHSVALPLISAGTYGVPPALSLSVARAAITKFLDEHDDVTVHLVLFDRAAVAAHIDSAGELAAYIDDQYVDEHADRYGHYSNMRSLKEMPILGMVEEIASQVWPSAGAGSLQSPVAAPAKQDLSELLDQLDASFSDTLLVLIDARGMTDAEVYKRANMSRQLFSKIRSDKNYRPKKKTVLALAVVLDLSLSETEDLLARAGFALSRSSKFDVIVKFYIDRGNCDIFEINEALFAHDQQLL